MLEGKEKLTVMAEVAKKVSVCWRGVVEVSPIPKYTDSLLMHTSS